MNNLTNSIAKAAEVLSLSRQTVYNEINAGRLKTYTVGRRRFISDEALRQFVRDREKEVNCETVQIKRQA